MKILISCVNSPQSLLGYDLASREIFWSTNSSQFKACGATYFQNNLLISSDDYVLYFTPEEARVLKIQGPYQPLAHSIHPVNEEMFGVVDTGHSALRVFKPDFSEQAMISPLAGWPQVPQDAIHLNDFIVTSAGVFASCFDYRPWRKIKDQSSFEDWCSGGYGLILNLTGYKGNGKGKVVLCDLCQPHSLTLYDGKMYCCSSGIGIVHQMGLTDRGTLAELKRAEISKKHFIRGLHFTENEVIIGGSTARHGQKLAGTIALYRADRELNVLEEIDLGKEGEIYDILPWDERMEVLKGTIEKFQMPG